MLMAPHTDLLVSPLVFSRGVRYGFRKPNSIPGFGINPVDLRVRIPEVQLRS